MLNWILIYFNHTSLIHCAKEHILNRREGERKNKINFKYYIASIQHHNKHQRNARGSSIIHGTRPKKKSLEINFP